MENNKNKKTIMFGQPESWPYKVDNWLHKFANGGEVNLSTVPLEELGAFKDKAIELGLYDSNKIKSDIPYNPKSAYSREYHPDYGRQSIRKRIKLRVQNNIKNGRAPYQDFSTSDIVIAEDLAKAQKRLEIFTGKKPVQLELPLDNPNITEGNENE